MKRKILTGSLIAAFAVVTGTAIGTAIPYVGATAVEYAPSTLFSAGTGGTVAASSAGEGEDSYVEFTISDGGAVNYRRDLALKWQAGKNDQKYFSMTFSLPEVNFDTLTIAFESAQENISKDGTTTNSLVFTYDAGTVNAACRYGEEEAGAASAVDVSGDVTVSFDGGDAGSFDVCVNGSSVGTFENIGGYFMEYLSSASSTPRIPMSFKAELQEGKSEQKITMKQLNGQTLKLTDGKVVDNAAPALVVNEQVSEFALGYKFSLSYEAIDVCDETVSVTREYSMYQAPAEGEAESDPSYASLTTSTYFLPQKDGNQEEYVSIRFTLEDGRTLEEGEEKYVYLSWYAGTVATHGGTDYIPVRRGSEGPAYACVNHDAVAKTSTLDESSAAYTEYAAAVSEAAQDLNAGSGAYFYLPSLRGLIGDDNTDYRNLKFTVYYKTQYSSTSKTASSLAYNALKFEISEESEYTFRVVATDKFGNAMKVYDQGRLVSVTADNVWDLDCIPQFTFTATSSGATVEDPGEQTIGYRGSKYTFSSFEIVAIAYETDYALYYFDQEKYGEDHNGDMPTYAEMVKSPADYKDYLVEIREYDDTVAEGDAAWDKTDNDYEWNASSLSFRPQKSGYYFLQATVTDTHLCTQTKAYQVVEVNNPVDEMTGETYWLQNNLVSIVLFSISGLLLVAIVVLLLVKPSDKKVDEVDVGALKGKKRKDDSE